ncbi:hypothetical protein CHUAL_009853 [Chamberlinius hualienensis]
MACIFYVTVLCFALLSLNLAHGQTKSNAPAKNNKFDQGINECYKNNKTNLEGCFLQFWHGFIPILKKGIPEYTIPSIEPLVIDQILFSEKSSLVSVSAKFTNVKVDGASLMEPQSVIIDRKGRKITLKLIFPFLNATGLYEMNGTVTLLPVDSKGKFSVFMTGINATATFDVVQVGTSTQMGQLIIDFDIKNFVVNVEGILDGGPIGDAINKLINENGRDVLADIKPSITKQLQSEIQKILKGHVVGLPVDAFS